MKWKEIREIFTFTKKEMNGILLLTFSIIAISIVRILIPLLWTKPPVLVEISFLSDTLTLEASREEQFSYQQREYSEKYTYENEPSADAYTPKAYPQFEQKKFERKEFIPLSINACDSFQLDAMPGISTSLASRIIKYRDKLGGFQHKEQLKEVYYIPDYAVDSLFKYSTGFGAGIEKVRINETSDSLLSLHPYLNKSLARTIVSYRNKHGAFQGCEDLKRVNRLDNNSLEKLCPYLDFSKEN